MMEDSDMDNPFDNSNSSQTGTITYSSDETMDWFEYNYDDTTAFGSYIGRYGDEIAYRNLGSARQNPDLQILGTYKLDRMINSVGYTIVCGSRNQVPNNPLLSTDRYDDYEDAYERDAIKGTIWTMLALYAPDQLRQKMAWSLSQIITLTPDLMDSRGESIPYLHFHDIFVRNSFGNHFDILREVAYHPLMGGFLTYMYNEALERNWHENSIVKCKFQSLYFIYSIISNQL